MEYSAYAQYVKPFGDELSKKIYFEAFSVEKAQKIALKKLSPRWPGWVKLNFLDVQQIKISRSIDNNNIIDVVVEESWFLEFNLKTRKSEWKKIPQEHMDKILPYCIERKDDPALFKQVAKLLR